MICAWKELLSILPGWLRKQVDDQGRDSLQELRLRTNAPPELILKDSVRWLNGTVSREDIRFCVNAASQYSPWAASTISQGYISAPGGHRIGLCGEVTCHNGEVSGIRDIRSVCIRVARDFPGIAKEAAKYSGSILVLGAPGWGKTTLLRDLTRQIAGQETVTVVDERGELFPEGFTKGKRMDVLTGCPKPAGIEMALRTMGPSCIALDEITAERDAMAMMQAVGCGVRLIATAHAVSMADFERRTIYRPIMKSGIFDTILILRRDKSYWTERSGV